MQKKQFHKMNQGACIFCGQKTSEIKSEVCGLKPKKQVNTRKILLKAADDLFSILVRAECGWRCIKCKDRFNPAASLTHYNGKPIVRMGYFGNSGNLHAAHHFKRANYNTRWDRFNVWAQCGSMRPGGGGRWVLIGCHADCENEGTEGWRWYRDYIIEQIGEERYKEMYVRANSPSAGHDKEMIIAASYKKLINLGYDMTWFRKSHQKHMKLNLERLP